MGPVVASMCIGTIQTTLDAGASLGILFVLVTLLLSLGVSVWLVPRILGVLEAPRWVKVSFAMLVFTGVYFAVSYVLGAVLFLGFVPIAGHFDQVWAIAFFALKLGAILVGVPGGVSAVIVAVAAVRQARRLAAEEDQLGESDGDLSSDGDPPHADER